VCTAATQLASNWIKIQSFAITAVCCDGLVATVLGHCRARPDADAATADAATMGACVFATGRSGDALSCTRPAIYAGDCASCGHASQAKAQTRGEARGKTGRAGYWCQAGAACRRSC